MELESSDTAPCEAKIIALLEDEEDLSSGAVLAAEHLGEWSIRFHLSPERSNLLRPFNFTGLRVLLIGAGVAGVARYLAEQAQELMVIEGTPGLQSIMASRLRDLKNWTAKTSRLDALELEKQFDVVCIIGAFEFAQKYFIPPKESVSSRFSSLLSGASRLLNPNGVLIVATENRLGLKYWAGTADISSQKLFDGICGYSVQDSNQLPSRKELLNEFREKGFSNVDEYFPFPDYRMTSSVLTHKLFELAPDLAADLAASRPSEDASQARVRLFPELLSTFGVARAGLLADLSNSLLFMASQKDSETRNKLVRSENSLSEVGWYFSNNRKIPSKTVFVASPLGGIHVEKTALKPNGENSHLFSSEKMNVEWKAIPNAQVRPGRKLHFLWQNYSYFGHTKQAYRLLKEFINWSFKHWEIAASEHDIRGNALDAILINASEKPGSLPASVCPRDFELFDLEWELVGPMPKTWFVFRNVFCLRGEFDLNLPTDDYRSFKELYELLCRELNLNPDFDSDVTREAQFQALVTPLSSVKRYREVILNQCLTPFRTNFFPKDPKKESILRHSLITVEEEKNKLKAVLDSPVHRFVSRLDSFLKRHRGLRNVLKFIFIFPSRCRARLANLSRHFISSRCKILSIPALSGVAPSMKTYRLFPISGGLPKRGWTRIKIQLEGESEFWPMVRLQLKCRGVNFYVNLSPPANGKLHTILKLSDGVEEMELQLDSGLRIARLKKVCIRQLSKPEAALRLVPPQLPSIFKNSELRKDFLTRGMTLWKDGKILGLIAWIHQQALLGNVSVIDYYSSWITRYDTLNDSDRVQIKEHIKELAYRPLISIVMPVYNTDEEWLVRAIDSVLRQLYPNWELCIADDKSTKPHVRKVLERYQKADPRIRVTYREKNGHISAASNSALQLASGEFVALFDHDDELTEHALYCVVQALNENEKLDLIYSDEDKIDLRGRRFQPNFKPDWNPELFYSYNLITHLSVFRTSLVREIEGFRLGYEGSQDYDLVLRFIEKISPNRIFHIPRVLYHWRAIPGSTAGGPGAKNYAHEAAQRAIRDHFARRGISASVSPGISEGVTRVQYGLPAVLPLVSIIICTRDKSDLLRVIVDGILTQTSYPALEVIIVDNQSKEEATQAYFQRIKKDSRVKVIAYDSPFNFSAMNNLGVKHAKGSLLAFLNNDLKVIHADWLHEMVRFVSQEKVGAVGAKLYFPDGTLQHAGVILGIGEVEGYSHGVAGHSHKGFPRSAYGFIGRAIVNQYLSAVTGACLLVRRDLFEKVGGFDEVNLAVAFNDIDLCLRIGQEGYKVVWTPYVELFHFESASRGSDQTAANFPRFQRECDYMMQRWAKVLEKDPHYNPNLTIEKEDFSLAFPPRVKQPWKKERLVAKTVETNSIDVLWESYRTEGNPELDR